MPRYGRMSRNKTDRKNRSPHTPETKEFIIANCEVDSVTGCWNWKRAVNKQGYGIVRSHGGSTAASVHRVSWIIWNGPIEGRLCVLHQCDNKRCCNPSHLRLGTHKENSREAVQRGRQKVKVTKEIAQEILNSNETMKVLSERLGIGMTAVWNVRHNVPRIALEP